jgi:hypothetical protein
MAQELLDLLSIYLPNIKALDCTGSIHDYYYSESYDCVFRENNRWDSTSFKNLKHLSFRYSNTRYDISLFFKFSFEDTGTTSYYKMIFVKAGGGESTAAASSLAEKYSTAPTTIDFTNIFEEEEEKRGCHQPYLLQA